LSNFSQFEFLCLGGPSSTTWGCIAANGSLVLNYGQGCTNNPSQFFNINFTLGTWHHITYVSTGVNGYTTMYIDGQLIGKGTTASSVGNCNSDKFNISTVLGRCCDEQYNKEKYPELKSPDYAFEKDIEARYNFYTQKHCYNRYDDGTFICNK
jgi:hypothetical protein